MIVSPNLFPAFGLPEILTVARDRELPAIFRTLASHRPIALRLALDSPPYSPSPARPTTVAPPVPTEPDLERRVRDMIAPIIAKLLAEGRSQKG